MLYGEYVFAVPQAKNNHFYYTKVRLQAEVTLQPTAGKVTIGFQDPLEPSPLNFWMGAQLGVAYVWESWPNHFTQSLEVSILDITGHPGDASPLMVAYATVFALLEALQWQPDQLPSFNLERDEFVFPRWIK